MEIRYDKPHFGDESRRVLASSPGIATETNVARDAIEAMQNGDEQELFRLIDLQPQVLERNDLEFNGEKNLSLRTIARRLGKRQLADELTLTDLRRSKAGSISKAIN